MFCFSFSSSKANSKIKIRKKKQVIFIFGNIVICIFYFLFSFWFPRLNQSFHSFISLPSPPPAYYMPLKINKQFPQNKKKILLEGMRAEKMDSGGKNTLVLEEAASLCSYAVGSACEVL